MNAQTKLWNGPKLKALLHAANHSKMRYPLLLITLVLLTILTLTVRELADGILADVQGAVEMLGIPL